MSVRILIDMNLSPDWVGLLEAAGWAAVHWSTVGDPRAADRVIMDWAVENGYIVFSHDLDFGTLLALTHARGPSVIQVRAQDVLPESLGQAVVAALQTHEALLEAGALIVVDATRARVRILPIASRDVSS